MDVGSAIFIRLNDKIVMDTMYNIQFIKFIDRALYLII